MSQVLVDTSVIIDFLRNSKKSQTWFYSLAEHDLTISIITHTELYAGKSVWERPEAKTELTKLFSGLTLLPITETISEMAGQLKARHNLSLFDALIGATALVHNLELATLNQKHFQLVPELKLHPGSK